jgi:chromosome segregation ATPase
MAKTPQNSLRETEEIAALRLEIACLRLEIDDLHMALQNTCEHGDLVEAQLAETNEQLQQEVEERRRAEERLRVLLERSASKRAIWKSSCK